MLVPSFADTKAVDKEGNWSPAWNANMSILLEQLQQNYSNAGLVVPTQVAENVAALQPTATIGTLLYNRDTDKLQVLLADGTFHDITTS